MASSDDSEDSGRHSHRQRHRTGDLSLFTTDGFSDQDPDNPPDRIVLINPYTQGTIVLEGPAANLDSLLRPGPPPAKSPHPPASGYSIDSMPRVERQVAGDDGACVICLEEWEWAREMPCGHRFHGECAERWLRVSGSCPVCRYQMPVDEEDEVGKKRSRGGTVYYYGGYGGEREVWVRMFFNRNRDRTSGASADDVSLDNNPNPASSS